MKRYNFRVPLSGIPRGALKNEVLGKHMNKNIRDIDHLKFINNVIVFNDIFFLHQENTGQQQFEYLIGNKCLEKEKVDTFILNIKENEKIRDKYGFKYKHIIFPAKAIAYSDEFLKIAIKIKKIATEECINLDSVYYCEVDKKHYPKDDTHTNGFSTIQMLNKICDSLNLDQIPSATYKESITMGDLSKMYDNTPRPRLVFDEFIIKNQLIKNRQRRESYIKRYSISPFCKGNAGNLDFIINPLPVFNERIVLFGDSFFEINLRIFYLLFNEVIYIRNSYILEDVIKVLKPDIVLTGNAERYLINVPNALNPRPFFMNYFTPTFKSTDIDVKTINAFEALFSGRDSKEYELFKKDIILNIKDKLENDRIYELTAADLTSKIDVDVCRDMAFEFELSDIKKAYHLMKIAHDARPNGPTIKAKYFEYKKILSGSI